MLARRMKPSMGSHTHLALGLGKLCFHQTGNKDVGNTYLGGLQCWNRFCFGLSLVFGLERFSVFKWPVSTGLGKENGTITGRPWVEGLKSGWGAYEMAALKVDGKSLFRKVEERAQATGRSEFH